MVGFKKLVPTPKSTLQGFEARLVGGLTRPARQDDVDELVERIVLVLEMGRSILLAQEIVDRDKPL